MKLKLLTLSGEAAEPNPCSRLGRLCFAISHISKPCLRPSEGDPSQSFNLNLGRLQMEAVGWSGRYEFVLWFVCAVCWFHMVFA